MTKAKEILVAANKAKNEMIGFRAHGDWFQIKKKKPGVYYLTNQRRSRWGNSSEIMQDLEHVLEFGTLPISKGQNWT